MYQIWFLLGFLFFTSLKQLISLKGDDFVLRNKRVYFIVNCSIVDLGTKPIYKIQNLYRFHTVFFSPISRRFFQIMLSKASELLLSIHNTIKKTNLTGLLILIRINFWIRGLGIHVHICTQYI